MDIENNIYEIFRKPLQILEFSENLKIGFRNKGKFHDTCITDLTQEVVKSHMSIFKNQ